MQPLPCWYLMLKGAAVCLLTGLFSHLPVYPPPKLAKADKNVGSLGSWCSFLLPQKVFGKTIYVTATTALALVLGSGSTGSVGVYLNRKSMGARSRYSVAPGNMLALCTCSFQEIMGCVQYVAQAEWVSSSFSLCWPRLRQTWSFVQWVLCRCRKPVSSVRLFRNSILLSTCNRKIFLTIYNQMS